MCPPFLFISTEPRNTRSPSRQTESHTHTLPKPISPHTWCNIPGDQLALGDIMSPGGRAGCPADSSSNPVQLGGRGAPAWTVSFHSADLTGCRPRRGAAWEKRYPHLPTLCSSSRPPSQAESRRLHGPHGTQKRGESRPQNGGMGKKGGRASPHESTSSWKCWHIQYVKKIRFCSREMINMQKAML